MACVSWLAIDIFLEVGSLSEPNNIHYGKLTLTVLVLLNGESYAFMLPIGVHEETLDMVLLYHNGVISITTPLKHGGFRTVDKAFNSNSSMNMLVIIRGIRDPIVAPTTCW